MEIFISHSVKAKLDDKHGGVNEQEIRQCFANLDGPILTDSRARHLTNPVTRWFIAETDYGRLLKIAYMPFPDMFAIKTAYEPNEDEQRIYREKR
jgi:hypothetical protein